MPGFVRYVPDPLFIEGMRLDTGNNEQLTVFAKASLEATINRAKGRAKRWYALDMRPTGQPQLISTSSFWHLAEYGSVNNPAYANMRRGVEASGAHFVDE